MAQIKIEITYDPSTETLAQAVSSLVPSTAGIDPDALGEAVTQEALARLGKTTGKAAQTNEVKAEGADPTPAATGETAASAKTGDQAAETSASGKPGASPSEGDVKKVSKTDVRAAATVLSKAGKREELSAIFAKFGGKKLSDIKEEDYPALILAHAYDEIKAYGYRKTDEPHSTRDEVKERVLNGTMPSAEAMENAEKINAWLVGLDQVTDDRWIGDLERNGSTLALSGYVKAKHFGRLVYMPIAYERYLEHKARDAQREAARLAETVSQHVGEVGQRITLTAATAKLLTSWEGAYGTTYLYKFTDAQGNVYIWYASRGIETRDGMTLKGTIKDHNERDGVKQTVLTRCKAA